MTVTNGLTLFYKRYVQQASDERLAFMYRNLIQQAVEMRIKKLDPAALEARAEVIKVELISREVSRKEV